MNFPDIEEKLSSCGKFTALIYLLDTMDPTIKLIKNFYPKILSDFQQNSSDKIFNHVYLLKNIHHPPSSLTYNLEIEKDILTRVNNYNFVNEPFTIISIGDKNSGKSTFNRFIANTFLSKKKYTVLWLDLDIGQPEFTISGFMSLIEIKEPILTPPPFHMKIEGDKILFVGKFEIETLHQRYITILQDLVRTLQISYLTEVNKCIVIVNTMGYIKEKGKDLLDEIIGILSPKLFVMCSEKEKVDYTNAYINNKNTITIERNHNNIVNKNYFNIKKSRIIDNGKEARRLRVIGYLSKIFNTFPQLPYSTNPARWPVYVVKMKNYFIFNEPGLPHFEESRFKESLEVTMVALCNFNDNDDSGFNKVPFNNPDLPTPIVFRFKKLSVKLNYRLTNLDSFGVGIITNVDMINKTLSICTPIQENIFKNKVKILARGRGLQIPPILLNCQVNDNYDGYRSLKSFSKEWLVFNQSTARNHEAMNKFKKNKDDEKIKRQRIEGNSASMF